MTLILESLALYFIFSVALTICSRLIRAVVAVLVFPVAVIRAVDRVNRKAGAREFHSPAYFLTGEDT